MTKDKADRLNIEAEFCSGFDRLSEIAFDCSERHGFHKPPVNFSEKAMLIVTEVGEAVEAMRHGNPRSKKIPSFSHVAEEYADAAIRLMDEAARLDLDLARAICAKMRYNEKREHQHGKQF